MNLTTVRDELVEQLQSITGLTVSERTPTTLQPPHAYINNIVAVEPSQTFDGLVRVEFELVVLVSLADDDNGWDKLSDLVSTGSGSIDYAVNTNSTLDGTIQYVDPPRFEAVGGDLAEYGAALYRGCVARITVHTF